jgi:serine protease AprX
MITAATTSVGRHRRRRLTIAAAATLAAIGIACVGAGTSSAARGVSWDPLVGTKGVSWDAFHAATLSTTSLTAYNALTDPGSMANVASMTGAPGFWNLGYTGQGVGVAVIDTGISPVGPLANVVVNGPDLSFDSQASNLQYLDGNGHGTFMAGIVNAMAPAARILNVKVGNYNGQVDVSQVIAAIDWVVQHRNDNGMNIRVLNLSYGTNSTQDYWVDPLGYAVEQAWKAGITVVTAAGNAGFAKGGTLTDPASDPWSIAVGATDSNGTLTTNDDTIASFSSNSVTGSSKRTVDLCAPGTHIVSLRDPGSFIDLNYGSTGYVTDTLFRGSGTSEAAAVVSGAAALVLSRQPSLSPDQVRAELDGSADHLSGISVQVQGNGLLDLQPILLGHSGSIQSYWWGNGTGLLESSRGDVHVSLNGVTLSGEQDIFGAPFNSASMAALEAAGNSWSGGTWNGNSWSGNSWSGNSWSGNSWSGNSWSGNSWSGNSWSGNSWSGNSWSGNSWSGNSWSGNSWSSAAWN